MNGTRMLRRAARATLLLLCLFAATVHAEVEVPPLQHRVTDLTGTLTAEQQAGLEARLADFEAKKGSQIAVLLVPTTQPEDIAQYSMRVVEQWKLGRKGVDDGVLLLVAKADRKMRIEVGYGLEGALPDAVAKRIVADVMAPHFKQGDFYGGIAAGVSSIIAVIEHEALPQPKSQPHSRAANGGVVESFIPVVLFGALVIGVVLRALLGSFVGGVVNGGLVGLAILLLGGGLIFALVLGLMAFMMTLGGGRGFPGGFGGSSMGSGGGFSGGGGGFGGGGASGNW